MYREKFAKHPLLRLFVENLCSLLERLRVPGTAVTRVGGGYRERQYQLAAQKKHAAFLRANYYQDTAKYFERQTGIAKQYHSWSVKDLDLKDQVDKAKKAENLLIRRNELRNLLREEEARYKVELEELRTRKITEPVLSLEALKEKLREKRAEQNLYLPQTCRRYQSYFADPRILALTNRKDRMNQSSPIVSVDSADSVEPTGRNGDNSYFRNARSMETVESACEETTNFLETRLSSPLPAGSQDCARPNSKYSARYARRSLEDTNVRYDEAPYGNGSPTSQRETRSACSVALNANDGAESSDKDNHVVENLPKEINENETVQQNFRRRNACTDTNANDDLRNVDGVATDKEGNSTCDKFYPSSMDPRPSPRQQRWSLDRSTGTTQKYHGPDLTSKVFNNDSQRGDKVDGGPVVRNETDGKLSLLDDHEDFESERSLPWLRMDPHEQNLSEQMFMYLHHKELKCKIEDLTKRELHACANHCWGEALRLREMRNRLEILREKRLYTVITHQLDEASRTLALTNILKREEKLVERMTVCTDTTLYSEDAKSLWKKWVQEDEKSVMKDDLLQRETLMKRLEKEWQNFAVRDKERITRSFQNVINDSSLQEEHKLTVAMAAAKLKSHLTLKN